MNTMNDGGVLQCIIRYCDRIEEAEGLFGKEYEAFLLNNSYRNACCICLRRIGELIDEFTEEFLSSHAGVPWKKIREFRNIVPHAYDTVEPATVWEIIADDIGELKEYCSKILNEEEFVWEINPDDIGGLKGYCGKNLNEEE